MFAFAWYMFGILTGSGITVVVMCAHRIPPIDKDKM
jgi:hypothetical protein